ncbi:probable WRKY transcription factor 32 isoform X2 [Telopea speciosissima]|uniref:probable WRKY transcription factor 32 isoform X2 n=1 Tax=Telopea speciosissima TaxID=54955 RepID=UPI001CC6E260|nr:probable WRKY transcription factor 32 isoform X2 [Telopea speciosissima]
MADSKNQGIKAPKVKETKDTEEKTEKIEEGTGEEQIPLQESEGSVASVTEPDPSPVGTEFRDHNSPVETLVVPPRPPPSSGNDHESDCRSFSQLLAGAMASPVANSTKHLSEGVDVKPIISTDPTGYPIVCPLASFNPTGFKEALASVTAQAAQAQVQKQLQIKYAPPSSELAPVSPSHATSSRPGSTPQQEPARVLQENNISTPEVEQQNSCDEKKKAALVVAKAPTSDGFNWRKYGQKQVKSTESSRSYYKCTYSDCQAKKKVERCDHTGRVTEIIYKGRHNHEPPRKIRCTKTRRFVPSAGPIGESETIDHSIKKFDDSEPSTSRGEPSQPTLPTLPTPEQKRHSSDASYTGAETQAMGKNGDEPEPKRRIKENNVAYAGPILKTIKEPKIVVQAAGDVGISSDGYRWRKYGQKMVKGNPYPRSYYKCTSAGCPVRKHVERAVDDSTAVIITYEGKHDHDMPVPKKRHGPPSAALLIAAAAAMNNSPQLKKPEALPNRRATTTKWSMDVEGEFPDERALELGGEKALESARTLLSIGIELKPC